MIYCILYSACDSDFASCFLHQSTPTSTVAISTTQSSQTTVTEQLPTTLSVSEIAKVERERKRLLKELDVLTILMQMFQIG